VVFFFQAEDGIRDLIVTGVQTCALPICAILVVTHGGKMSSSVVVFLGNGDGTFRPPVAYKTGHSPLNVSVLDLNGDRHQDLLVRSEERRVGKECRDVWSR